MMNEWNAYMEYGGYDAASGRCLPERVPAWYPTQ